MDYTKFPTIWSHRVKTLNAIETAMEEAIHLANSISLLWHRANRRSASDEQVTEISIAWNDAIDSAQQSFKAIKKLNPEYTHPQFNESGFLRPERERFDWTEI